MACKNKSCKYNDAKAANGCKLFPGASWLNCKGASVTTIRNNQPQTTPKGK